MAFIAIQDTIIVYKLIVRQKENANIWEHNKHVV